MTRRLRPGCIETLTLRPKFLLSPALLTQLRLPLALGFFLFLQAHMEIGSQLELLDSQVVVVLRHSKVDHPALLLDLFLRLCKSRHRG